MSTNYTEHLGLCLWAAQDPVLRTEFNTNNQKLDAAIRKVPRMAVGSYVGDGTSGEDSPCSLTFDFEPMLVIIVADHGEYLEPGAIFVNGQNRCSGMGLPDSSLLCLHLQLTWSENGVSWYTDRSSNADHQLNAYNLTYRFFALGS